MNKYLALQKDVFDISKVTVVGNPTITSDGVASGFDTSSQVAGFLTFTATKSIKYKIRITTATDITTYQYMMRFYNNVNGTYATHAIALQNGVFRWIFKDSGTVEIGTVSPNTQYDLTLFIDGVNNIGRCYINGVEQSKSYSSPILMAGNNSAIGFGNMGSAFGNNGQNATALDRPFFGSVDLKYCSVEVDNQLIYSPTKPTYLLERRKPKVWNKGQFTVVGSPVISDDGVASGFSTNNCLLVNLDNPITNNNTQLKVLSKAVLGEKTGTSIVLFHTDTTGGISSGFTVQIDDVYNRIWINGYGYIGINYNFQVGDIIEVEAIWDFQSFSETINVLVNGQTKLTNTKTFASAEFSVNRFSISGTPPKGSYAWSGSIDLNSFKIYTDNNLVFDGGAETYVYDPSKFTVIGSPTITEYGVASNFSSGNYPQISNISTGSSPWEISGKFAYQTKDTVQAVFAGTNNTYAPLLYVGSTYMQLHIPSMQGTWGWQLISNIYNDFVVGNWYYYKVGWDGANYYIKISKDNGQTYTTLQTMQGTAMLGGNGVFDLVYGWNNGVTDRAFQGLIDLPSISITVDGKEVFTGAKENFYMLRR